MANGSKNAPGQQKLHTITNSATGETQQVTQEDWRIRGRQLRAEGWTRPEDLPEEEEPEQEIPGETPTEDEEDL